MNYNEFIEELDLKNKVLAIFLTNTSENSYETPESHCIMKEIDKLEEGKKLLISEETLKCPGGKCGAGYNDDLPDIKGGFGHFISYGKKNTKNERYPKGEKIKKNPEIGEDLIKNNPKDVLKDFKYILIKHYKEGDKPKTVSIKVNNNQLSALAFLFNFERANHNNIYVCTSSGCSSILKIPFDEAERNTGRGVIGNVDIVGRFFTENDLYFTISGKEFEKMIENADKSFITTPAWKNLKNKIR